MIHVWSILSRKPPLLWYHCHTDRVIDSYHASGVPSSLSDALVSKVPQLFQDSTSVHRYVCQLLPRLL